MRDKWAEGCERGEQENKNMDARKKVAKRNMAEGDKGGFLVAYLTTLSVDMTASVV